MTTFVEEAAKLRLEHAEGWLMDTERTLREQGEALIRQADSCALAVQAIADYRDMLNDMQEIERMTGGPVAITPRRRVA